MNVQAEESAILIVDSGFAFRAESNDHWDYRIYLDVDRELSITRGIARDSELEGVEEAENLHRNRYGVAEDIYSAEVDRTRWRMSSSTTLISPIPRGVQRPRTAAPVRLRNSQCAWGLARRCPTPGMPR